MRFDELTIGGPCGLPQKILYRRGRPCRPAAGACPGKVGTGFPKKDMRQRKKVERIPIYSIGMRSGRGA
jgi:hypothetical protein